MTVKVFNSCVQYKLISMKKGILTTLLLGVMLKREGDIYGVRVSPSGVVEQILCLGVSTLISIVL